MIARSLTMVGVLMLAVQTTGAQQGVPKQTAEAPSVQRFVDARTGLELRLRRVSPQELIVDVGDERVSVQKQVKAGSSITTLTSGGDRLQISTTPGEMRVSGAAGVLFASGMDVASLDRLAEILQQSPVAEAALALLTRLDLSPDSVPGNTLLLTRAMLEVPRGRKETVTQYRRWADETFRRPRMIQAAYQRLEGPGVCWDAYESWVWKIADDYVRCYNGCRWYEIFCRDFCAFKWVIQAELAFDWLIACCGGLPVR